MSAPEIPEITDAGLSEAEYRLLWETSTDAVVILDRESTILFTNPAVADVFGYRPEELLGRNIAVLQPERLRESASARAGTLSRDRREESELARDRGVWPAPAGARVSDRDRVQPSRASMAADLFAAFIRDISDRKQAEEALRVNRRADGSGARRRGRGAVELPVAAGRPIQLGRAGEAPLFASGRTRT